MNTNKINNILDLFDKFQVRILKENAITKYVRTSEVVGDPYNKVIYLECEDDIRGNEYSVKFTEAGLDAATVADGKLVMKNDKGESIKIEFQEIKKVDLMDEFLFKDRQ